MKKKLIISLSLFYFISFSQEMYKIEYSYKDWSQTTKCALFANNKEAIFKFYDERAMGVLDLPNGDVTHVANDELAKFYYTNDKLVYCRHIFNVYEILYFDEYKEKVKWTINIQNKKKIGIYTCTEAKTRLNGRNYTVWFTLEVPMKYGPMKFHNLPGLVLEVAEENGYFTLSFVKILKISKPKEFDFFKNYFFETEKPVHNYFNYEQKATETVISNRVRAYSEIKKMNLDNGGSITIDDDMADKNDINMFVDIPKNLKSELKKHYF